MHRDLQKSDTLLIISDTAMFIEQNEVYAFGPVVRELEALTTLFSSVTWIGFLKPEFAGDPAFKKIDPKFVTAIMIPKTGGHSIAKKIDVLFKMPKMFRIIYRQITKHHIIHTRAPSSPAFIGILLSWGFKNKIWWHKYAGNWVQKNPSFLYGLQIFLLKLAKHTKVTINGKWLSQPGHCLSFENPTITLEDQKKGYRIQSNREYIPPFNFCFVGRLESEKGLTKVLKAYEHFADNELFGQLHIVGSGPLEGLCLDYQKKYPSVIFNSSLSRNELDEIYKKCHFLYLPSTASEGFPKVIAEGANFGCIPIVSGISSIAQYISDGKNGFVLRNAQFTEKDIISITNSLFLNTDLFAIALAAFEFSKKFTYRRYVERIKHEILMQ